MTTPKYTLYELVAHAEQREAQTSHSFFVLRSKLDLALLDIPYTRVPLAFEQIKPTLAAAGPGATVPALDTGADAGLVVDSFTIAEYLDEHHATESKYLFGSPDARRFARFVQLWADKTLLLAIMPLLVPLFVAHNDAASRAYFVARIWPADDVARMVEESKDADRVKENAAAVRRLLRVVELYLGASDGRFLLGDVPTHADNVVASYYFASQINPVLNPLVWEHPDLPRVAQWVKDFKEVSGFSVSYPPPPAGVVAEL
ncbi:hypothetical protein VHUM_02393 [Vanrija humicola]|uniref:Uncharacterized protein n=1 Tax=Vanrija humicola TaxID=5417 RepID=A0A7D8YYQ0_VANHU|nr:hypothetical protein VHUM_02393 [Vanrija humicola]